MDFLNNEAERLLKECIDNSGTFPRNLAEKFNGLSFEQDKRLRGIIKELVDGGYFSKLQWADNVPWNGSITEKGYSYFHDKDVYIRARLKREDGFKLLDDESEDVLKELLQAGSSFVKIEDNVEKTKVVEHLAKLGYITVMQPGITFMSDGRFTATVSINQSGKLYFSEKENLIEEIMILGSDKPADSNKHADWDNPVDNEKTAKKPNSRANRGKLFQVTADSDKYIFSGILGFDCGRVEAYEGEDKRLQEKGFIVKDGIPTLRGFAKISDLAKASKAKYEEYQRNQDTNHVNEIASFLKDGRAEAKFLPEIVLSVTNAKKAVLLRYDHRSFSKVSSTVQGAIDNMDYYTIEVEAESLARVDGNHRLEAGKDQDLYVPFSIIVWGIDSSEEDNLISAGREESNIESEAFLFYILNNTAKRLEAEENFKGLVKSETWTNDELTLINRQLPIIKHFDREYNRNPLLDKEYLHAPLSQTCDILAEIDDPDLGIEEFDAIIKDALRLLGQTNVFDYCKDVFSPICYQLAFYARYKSDDYENAFNNLRLVNNWLQKYKYSGNTFTKASKIYDVAYKFITSSPKTIFMAMQYKSDQVVADYNGALKRAVETLNNMGGSISVEAYPIMTGKGKSINITSDIYSKIENCAIFIADTTEANPNVMYELGLAYSKNKPIIMVREKGKNIKVPSDIISDYYYSFDGMTELETLFFRHIKEILVSDYGAIFPE